jgi:hypothetical protein
MELLGSIVRDTIIPRDQLYIQHDSVMTRIKRKQVVRSRISDPEHVRLNTTCLRNVCTNLRTTPEGEMAKQTAPACLLIILENVVLLTPKQPDSSGCG